VSVANSSKNSKNLKKEKLSEASVKRCGKRKPRKLTVTVRSVRRKQNGTVGSYQKAGGEGKCKGKGVVVG